MNEDLFAAAVEYPKWYVERFKATQPDWYVFPAGRPSANDPTRPQTTLKTAWCNARAGDEVIRDLAGDVSKDMLKQYSHIRIQAKRQAVENLMAKPKAQESQSKREPAQSVENSEGTVQDPVQVSLVN